MIETAHPASVTQEIILLDPVNGYSIHIDSRYDVKIQLKNKQKQQIKMIEGQGKFRLFRLDPNQFAFSIVQWHPRYSSRIWYYRHGLNTLLELAELEDAIVSEVQITKNGEISVRYEYFVATTPNLLSVKESGGFEYLEDRQRTFSIPKEKK